MNDTPADIVNNLNWAQSQQAPGTQEVSHAFQGKEQIPNLYLKVVILTSACLSQWMCLNSPA